MIPSAIPIEKDVIGLVLVEGRKALDCIGGQLMSDHFLDPPCRAIWDAVTFLDAQGEWTSSMVTQRLYALEVLNDIGGASVILELLDNAPATMTMMPNYIAQLSEARERRRLLATARRMAENATDMAIPFSASVIEAQDSLIAIASQGTGSEPIHIKEILKNNSQDLLRVEPKQGGILSGFNALDETIRGFHRGQMVVVAARPSVGKSTLLHGIATNVASAGFPTLLVTLEMTAAEIVTRMAVGGANVPIADQANGTHNKTHRNAIIERVMKLKDIPLWLHDAAGATIAQLRATTRAMVARHGIAVVLVDYLQLVAGKSDDRRVEVGQVSRGLKAMAKESGVVAIAAAQLSRSGDAGEPKLSHLRESGDIEQDADIVGLMWRPDGVEREHSHGVQIRIAKHRGGPIGDGTLFFLPQFCKFMNQPNQ